MGRLFRAFSKRVARGAQEVEMDCELHTSQAQSSAVRVTADTFEAPDRSGKDLLTNLNYLLS
jgi:hypothetical protein